LELEILTRHYDVPPEQLWEALRSAVDSSDKFEMEREDPETFRAEFTTGFTAYSWGKSVVAQIVVSRRGGSLLRVNARPKNGFLTTRWGEEQEVPPLERELSNAVERALG